MEKTARKRPGLELAEAVYSFMLIRLARLAIGVPKPPISTPNSKERASEVKPESNRAAGTLLIIWLVNKLTK